MFKNTSVPGAHKIQVSNTAAKREVEEKQILMKDLSDSYDEIISWSELYDSASLEAKKMIVNAMITRIDV